VIIKLIVAAKLFLIWNEPGVPPDGWTTLNMGQSLPVVMPLLVAAFRNGVTMMIAPPLPLFIWKLDAVPKNDGSESTALSEFAEMLV
jgi:hypothetical protein